MATELVHKRYNAKIDDIAQVYDGDTIEGVLFKLPGVQAIPQAELGEIYPDAFLHDDGLWIRISVRLAGIDCPERHPRHNLPDGTPRPATEIERERTLGLKARNALRALLNQSQLQFELRNCEIGKYASRIVGEVWVHEEDSGDYRNVSEYLIDKALAYPYQGGTKRIWGRLD